jgi:hypothetical protein
VEKTWDDLRTQLQMRTTNVGSELHSQRPVKGSELKRWALAVARLAGARKAKVARKLAYVLRRTVADGTALPSWPGGRPEAGGRTRTSNMTKGVAQQFDPLGQQSIAAPRKPVDRK